MRRCHAGLFPGTRSRQTGHVSSRWKENACRRLKESLGNERLRIIFPFVVYRCWRTDSSNCSITAGWKSAWPASREFLEERNDEGADELFFRLIGDRRISPISVMFLWENLWWIFLLRVQSSIGNIRLFSMMHRFLSYLHRSVNFNLLWNTEKYYIIVVRFLVAFKMFQKISFRSIEIFLGNNSTNILYTNSTNLMDRWPSIIF